MLDVILLKAEEWEGLYVDGLLIEEAHHIGEGMGLLSVLHPIVNGNLWSWREEWADEDAMDLEMGAGFPQNWSDVVVD